MDRAKLAAGWDQIAAGLRLLERARIDDRVRKATNLDGTVRGEAVAGTVNPAALGPINGTAVALPDSPYGNAAALLAALADLLDGIDADDIADGSVSNAEFETLDGINTAVSIQTQLDALEDFDTNAITLLAGKSNVGHTHTTSDITVIHWLSSAHADAGLTTMSVVGMPAWSNVSPQASNDSGNGSFHNYRTSASSGNAVGPNGPNIGRPDQGITASFQVRIVDTTNIRVWVALAAGDPSGSATPAVEMAGFRFDTGASDTTWQCRTRDGTTGGISNSGVAVSSAVYRLRMVLDGSQVLFYINDTLVATRTTNLPGSSTLLAPYVRVTTLTTATKNLGFGYYLNKGR